MVFPCLQQELVHLITVQFLCIDDGPLWLPDRNSTPDWGTGAIQKRRNHTFCVYGRPVHQQQDIKYLIVFFSHALILGAKNCVHTLTGEKPLHQKAIHQDRKKSLPSFLMPAECGCDVSCLDSHARCDHVTIALCSVWYYLSEMRGCLVILELNVCACVHTCERSLDTCTCQSLSVPQKCFQVRKKGVLNWKSHVRVLATFWIKCNIQNECFTFRVSPWLFLFPQTCQ